MATSFSDLGLNQWLLKQCSNVGLAKPSEIQRNCIPHILKGRDCVGCSQTGTGKTAAFALPILQLLSEEPYGIFALILTPTRELANQITEQIKVLGKPINTKVALVTGGMDMVHQGLLLSTQPHIVVANPGRLSDLIDSGCNFSLDRIKFLVLDEADRLLEDNFGEQLKTIFLRLPRERQTLLFSATLTKTIEQLPETLEKASPFVYVSEQKVITVAKLDERYALVPADLKDAYLFHILDKYLDQNPSSCVLVFTKTCRYCQILTLMGDELGFKCVSLHSGVKQRLRLGALSRFKSHQCKLMFATDLASRGLDIPTCDLVINHNIPTRAKDYVHRCGRTARAGREGTAISLVTQYELNLIQNIESEINKKLTEYPVKDKAVAEIATEVSVAKREAEIFLDETDFAESKEINKRKRLLLQGIDPEEEEHTHKSIRKRNNSRPKKTNRDPLGGTK